MEIYAVEQLASYVDALRPIIYINHFDFSAVDTLIGEVASNKDINEFNDANGFVDFKFKNPKFKGRDEYDLETVLQLFNSEDKIETFLVLKDIHSYFSNSKIIALLKSIAFKTIKKDDFYVTIFIVDSNLFIPDELNSLVTIFDIPVPKLEQIKNIIRNYSIRLGFEIEYKNLVDDLAISFKGLSEFNIIQILNLAYQDGGCITYNDKHLIAKEKEQIIKKSGILEILNYKESIEDIGGLNHLKAWLQKKAIIFKDLDRAIRYGVDIPKGIMLVGMPGCGKSLVAKATSQLFSVPLLRLDIGKILGKYIGESEENLRRAIQISEAVSPCILWVDEIEKAFAGIGQIGGGSDVTTRLFGSFLTWLQEKENTVFVVATSNDITKFPPEFLRKGRFDELFFIDFPNGEERQKIFEIHLIKRGKWHRDINTISLVKETEGYSGADIEAVVKETVENAFIQNERYITTEKLLFSVKEITPLSKSLESKIKVLKDELDKYDLKPASLSIQNE